MLRRLIIHGATLDSEKEGSTKLEVGLRMGTKCIHVGRDGGMGTRRTMSSVQGI